MKNLSADIVTKPIATFQPAWLDKVNYLALLLLERLGNDKPTQMQIDRMEIIINKSMNINGLTLDIIKRCIATNTIASRILVRYISDYLN